jgi:hypothetical protein
MIFSTKQWFLSNCSLFYKLFYIYNVKGIYERTLNNFDRPRLRHASYVFRRCAPVSKKN